MMSKNATSFITPAVSSEVTYLTQPPVLLGRMKVDVIHGSIYQMQITIGFLIWKQLWQGIILNQLNK
jgi:hypothetical protein